MESSDQLKLLPEEDCIIDVLSKLPPPCVAYCVGGWVRDKLLNHRPKDIDIVISGGVIEESVEHIHQSLKATQYLKTPPRKTPRSDKFDVWTLETKNYQIDVRLMVNTLDHDIQGRDFTVNAIYYDTSKRSIVKNTAGLKHLKSKILCCTSTPEKVFGDDPVRLLRLVRFQVDKEFSMDENLQAYINEKRFLQLHTAEYGKILSELKKHINSTNIIKLLEKLHSTKLLAYLEGEPESDCFQNCLRWIKKLKPHEIQRDSSKLFNAMFFRYKKEFIGFIFVHTYQDRIKSGKWQKIFNFGETKVRNFESRKNSPSWEECKNPPDLQKLKKNLLDTLEETPFDKNDERSIIVCAAFVFALCELNCEPEEIFRTFDEAFKEIPFISDDGNKDILKITQVKTAEDLDSFLRKSTASDLKNIKNYPRLFNVKKICAGNIESLKNAISSSLSVIKTNLGPNYEKFMAEYCKNLRQKYVEIDDFEFFDDFVDLLWWFMKTE